ncbi:hypothetical protein B0H17DRAFT_1200596 [Mycena rosella]|uniref:Uncharacterized protein n=1 Tax=Mycena rosella TaxID=1033263 RepID=A0AAD7GKL2_MYCRO|nr:hypothetical protein B0H17DRAFT_1200596 [Mycena rosella]
MASQYTFYSQMRRASDTAKTPLLPGQPPTHSLFNSCDSEEAPAHAAHAWTPASTRRCAAPDNECYATRTWMPANQRDVMYVRLALTAYPVRFVCPEALALCATTSCSAGDCADWQGYGSNALQIVNNEFRPHVAALDRLRTWNSPYGLEHNSEFRKQFPEEVVNKTYAALFGSFAPETHSNYVAGLLRFHQFCDLHKISERARMPASHFLLAAFISQHVGTTGGGTVQSWMSGLKAWHDINGAPWEGKDRWVELARRTANKQGTAFKRAQRGPVTIQHMITLRSSLNLSQPFDAAVWALACAAFWGCRRLGELTVPSPDKFDPNFHVSRSATVRQIFPNSETSAITIPLPWTKSTRERGAMLTLTGRADELCPEKAFRNHQRISAAVPGDAPLFAFSASTSGWSPMTKNCYRIGGSTELLLAGVPCDIGAALGGWTSLAFLLYWRKIEHIVPMNIGKAYDKDKLADVAKAFESFRIAHGITLPSADEL